ncbi:hypothetical protein ACVR0A_06655 [Streptococcus downei]|nr:hypothetical protein [Streptococcus downei]EFQ57987.1 hypothetical protein HMPREF9176_2121 [Streptococcus downei F0415]
MILFTEHISQGVPAVSLITIKNSTNTIKEIIMLKDLLKPNSKMSKKSYKTYLLIYSISLIAIGGIIALTSASMTQDKYFGYGLSTGLILGALIVIYRTLSQKQFEKLYLDAFDERNQFINSLCYKLIFVLELLILMLTFLINLYIPLHFNFERVLTWSLIFLAYGYLIIRTILRKLV